MTWLCHYILPFVFFRCWFCFASSSIDLKDPFCRDDKTWQDIPNKLYTQWHLLAYISCKRCFHWCFAGRMHFVEHEIFRHHAYRCLQMFTVHMITTSYHACHCCCQWLPAGLGATCGLDCGSSHFTWDAALLAWIRPFSRRQRSFGDAPGNWIGSRRLHWWLHWGWFENVWDALGGAESENGWKMMRKDEKRWEK